MKPLQEFSKLIEPLGAEEFLRDYFEKKPLYVKASDPQRFDHIISLQTFAKIISGTDPSRLNMRTFLKGVGNVPTNFSQIHSVIQEGGTVTAQALEHLHPPVAGICRVFEGLFYQTLQTNAYLTPGENKGLAVHYDLHDVFVLQISGKKHWRVYGREAENPLTVPTHGVDPNLPRETLIDIVLEPGDLLYFPRGFTHEAITTGAEPSLHLSLGVLGFSWGDLLSMVLKYATHTQPGLRAMVPLGPHVGAGRDLKGELDEAIKLVAAGAHEYGVADAESLFINNLPFLTNSFSLSPEEPVGPDTKLKLAPWVLPHVQTGPDAILVVFQGKKLQLPLIAEPALRYVLDSQATFVVGEMPIVINDATLLRLVQYFYDNGLVERA